jgi:hypothetical protein
MILQIELLKGAWYQIRYQWRTLDAILVPDFGQTKFDNAILNLEPFEQRLMRPLQKELIYSTLETYYSRRIGEHQATTPMCAANEEVTNYPSSVN